MNQFVNQFLIKIHNLSLSHDMPKDTPSREILKRMSSKRESVKDTSSNTQLIAIKVDLEKEQKRNKELKQLLEDKVKLATKLENERDMLENEKALFDTERKVKNISNFIYLSRRGVILKNIISYCIVSIFIIFILVGKVLY